jgi:hypothetical protein
MVGYDDEHGSHLAGVKTLLGLGSNVVLTELKVLIFLKAWGHISPLFYGPLTL